jgi:iron complex outermembrane recepter protein
MHRRLVSGRSVAAALTAFVVSAPLVAQDAPTAQAESASSLEEVVVTARKREESLQDIPLAISAYTSEQIEESGFKNLQDVAQFTPGIQFNKQAAQRLGRINTSIRFRGMNVNSETPQFQLASLFIDGMYVMGSAASIGLDDVERVEIIKGPQAAFFGRNTYGGAVNYITREPGNEWKSKLSASFAQYGDYEVSAGVEGAVVEDLLQFRLSGRFYKAGAQWTANDGGDLGEEQTEQVNLVLRSQPTDKLKLRFRGSYLQDNDGPAAGGFISGNIFDTCTGLASVDSTGAPIINPVTGVQAQRGRYVCGAIPQPSNGVVTVPDNPNIPNTATNSFQNQFVGQSVYLITQNTQLVGQQQLVQANAPNLLRDVYVTRTLPNAQLNDALALDGFGLKRFSYRLGFMADYDLPGNYTLSASYSYNKERVNYLRDFDVTDIGSFWESDPRDLNDRSFEFRVTSPQDGRFRWLAGYNQYKQLFTGAGDGGLAISSCYFRAAPGIPPAASAGATCSNLGAGQAAIAPVGVFIGGGGNREQRNQVETQGLFFGATFDFTDQWALSVEARYLKDTVKRFNTTNVTPIPSIGYVPVAFEEEEFKETLPRVILQYKPFETTNIYLSYAEGILPGEINARYAFGTADERAQYEALVPGIQDFTGPESLQAWEIGWKQQLLDGRAAVNLTYYNYPDWDNQKGRVVANIFETNPMTGLRNAGPNSRNVVVVGSSELQGLELDASWRATPNWDLQLGAEWTKNEYKDFIFNFVAPLVASGVPVINPATGSPYPAYIQSTQMRGNTAPRYPEWRVTAGTTFRFRVKDESNWFTRWDASTQGETFVDESNLATADGFTIVNARVGYEKEKVRAEFFVTNLFDEENWAVANRWTDFSILGNILGLTSSQGILVSPQPKRQYGLRFSYEF